MATTKVAPQASVKYDAGPLLIEAARAINGSTSNPEINAKISRIEDKLAANNISNRSWVGRLLYQVRGIHQGVVGDADLFIANLAIGRSSGALGPRASSVLREIANQGRRSVPEAGKLRAGMSGSIGIGDRSSTAAGKPNVGGAVGALIGNLRAKSGEAGVSSTGARKPVKTPTLDKAIDAADTIGKLPLPEGLKAAVDGLKSALKVARTTQQQKGTGPEYAAETAKIGQAMLKVIAEIVKWGASNPKLAAQAAEQLGKIASFLGAVAKVFDAIKHLRTLLSGTASANAKAEALVGLVGLAGPIGNAAKISLEAYKALFNLIAVPILDDTKAIGKNDLRRVFDGKTPEQLKAEILALPTSPDKAKWVIRRLDGNTFIGESRFNTGYSVKELWARHRQPLHNSYLTEINQIYAEERWTNGTPSKITGSKLTEIATAYKEYAITFIDREVQKLSR